MTGLGSISDLPRQRLYRPSHSPHFIRFVMGLGGLEAPRLQSSCEIGAGHGISTTVHAACNQDSFWIGTKFNSNHAKCAEALSRNVPLENLRFDDELIPNLCGKYSIEVDSLLIGDDWSWLSPGDQSAILAPLKRDLRAGGIFCLEHATLPGQGAASVLARMLGALAGEGGSTGTDPAGTIPRAIARALEFCDANPAALGHHWGLRSTLEDLACRKPEDVARIYLDGNWRPRYFQETDRLLKAAGLAWACSWSPTEFVEDLDLTPQQRGFLGTIADASAREQLRDLTVYRALRRDIFMRRGNPARHAPWDLLEGLSVVLVRPPEEFSYRAEGCLGEVALARDLYLGLIETLADHCPARLADLPRRLGARAEPADILEALALLLGQQFIQPVNPSAAEIGRSVPSARALNLAILAAARDGDDMAHLGSPLTGAGIRVPRLHLLFLLAREEGVTGAPACAAFAQDVLARAGEPLRTQRINREAENFAARYLPIYQRLLLVDAA